MRLEEFHETERIYIDSAIFISHHSMDSADRKECTAFLDTDRHYKILDALRHDRNVFDEAWMAAQEHIDYVDALRRKNSLHIITQMADPLDVKDIAKKYQLLPRDASHFGIMMNNRINHIATSDSDFERITGISVWRP